MVFDPENDYQTKYSGYYMYKQYMSPCLYLAIMCPVILKGMLSSSQSHVLFALSLTFSRRLMLKSLETNTIIYAAENHFN